MNKQMNNKNIKKRETFLLNSPLLHYCLPQFNGAVWTWEATCEHKRLPSKQTNVYLND